MIFTFRTLCATLSLIFLLSVTGCGDRSVEGGVRGGVGDSSTEELEREIRRSTAMSTNVGSRTSSWAISVANRIQGVSDAVERRRLSALYFDQFAQIDPLASKSKMRARALNNFAQRLEPYEMLLPNLEDAERPFELMCTCLRYYHQAIREEEEGSGDDSGLAGTAGRSRWRVGRRDPAWNYKAGLELFALAVTNSYLPRTRERGLLGEKYEYWRMRLEREIVGPTAQPTSILPLRAHP